MFRHALCGLTFAAALLATGCNCFAKCKQWTVGNPMFSSARRCDVAPYATSNYPYNGYYGAAYPGNPSCGPCGNGANYAPAAPFPPGYGPPAGYGAPAGYGLPPANVGPTSSNSAYQQQQQQQTTSSQPPPPLPPYDPNQRNDYARR